MDRETRRGDQQNEVDGSRHDERIAFLRVARLTSQELDARAAGHGIAGRAREIEAVYRELLLNNASGSPGSSPYATDRLAVRHALDRCG